MGKIGEIRIITTNSNIQSKVQREYIYSHLNEANCNKPPPLTLFPEEITRAH